MQSIVISLKTAINRRQHIEQQFGQQSIPFEFFDAITPDLALSLAQKIELNIKDEFLAPRELACFMSHVSIWQKMIDEEISYLAIFEDDVYLGENVSALLNQSDWIAEDWHIIKIEAFEPKVYLGSQNAVIGSTGRHIAQLKGKNLGAAGYILSLQGAKSYLEYIKSVSSIALDQLIFDHYIQDGQLKIYQITPALCIQEMMLYPEKAQTGLVSDLVIERKKRMKKYKKVGWEKIKHEIVRIFKQIHKVIFAKTVEFK